MRLIETKADVAAGVEALIAADRRFEKILAVTGEPPLRRSEPGFKALLYIITEQQISLHAAAAIWDRTQTRLAPLSAQSIATADDEAFRAAGQSRAKVAAMRACATAVVGGDLDLERLHSLDDEAAMAELTRIKGIGPWTAQIYLLACMGRPDVWPSGDVALMQSAQTAFDLAVRPDRREMIALAQGWRPWRAIAARLLWAFYRSMNNMPAGG